MTSYYQPRLGERVLYHSPTLTKPIPAMVVQLQPLADADLADTNTSAIPVNPANPLLRRVVQILPDHTDVLGWVLIERITPA